MCTRAAPSHRPARDFNENYFYVSMGVNAMRGNELFLKSGVTSNPSVYVCISLEAAWL